MRIRKCRPNNFINLDKPGKTHSKRIYSAKMLYRKIIQTHKAYTSYYKSFIVLVKDDDIFTIKLYNNMIVLH